MGTIFSAILVCIMEQLFPYSKEEGRKAQVAQIWERIYFLWESFESVLIKVISSIRGIIKIFKNSGQHKVKIEELEMELERYSAELYACEADITSLKSMQENAELNIRLRMAHYDIPNTISPMLAVSYVQSNAATEIEKFQEEYNSTAENMMIRIIHCMDHVLLVEQEIQKASQEAEAERTNIVRLAAENKSVVVEAVSEIAQCAADEIQSGYSILKDKVNHLKVVKRKLEELMEAQRKHQEQLVSSWINNLNHLPLSNFNSSIFA